MERFIISERYRLEIHWKKVKYEIDQIALIEGCYLSGPVLKEAVKLNDQDYIDLDFVGQYLVFVDNYYIARLSWNDVEHRPEKIFLRDVKLENKNLNVVPKLNNNDYIVVDTKDHEEETHMYHLVYPAYLIRKDGALYNFGDMK
jgi:hypothetical protein